MKENRGTTVKRYNKISPGDYTHHTEEILKLKEELDSLRSENLILRNVIATMPGNVYWKDTEGKYLGCNNNMAKILGFHSPETMLGKKSKDIYNYKLKLLDYIDTQVYAGQEKYIEEQGFNLEKKPAIYLTKKVPLHHQGKIIGMQVFQKD